MSDVYVVRNQHGLFASKQKEWLDGREPKLLFRSPHHDEAINLVFELSSKDIYVRAAAINVELGENKHPVIEVTAPPPELDDGAKANSQDNGQPSLDENSSITDEAGGATQNSVQNTVETDTQLSLEPEQTVEVKNNESNSNEILKAPQTEPPIETDIQQSFETEETVSETAIQENEAHTDKQADDTQPSEVSLVSEEP